MKRIVQPLTLVSLAHNLAGAWTSASNMTRFHMCNNVFVIQHTHPSSTPAFGLKASISVASLSPLTAVQAVFKPFEPLEFLDNKENRTVLCNEGDVGVAGGRHHLFLLGALPPSIYMGL